MLSLSLILLPSFPRFSPSSFPPSSLPSSSPCFFCLSLYLLPLKLCYVCYREDDIKYKKSLGEVGAYERERERERERGGGTRARFGLFGYHCGVISYLALYICCRSCGG